MGHGLIAWIIIGLIAGWLTGKLMKGSGFGFLMDMIVGLVGALVGGAIFRALTRFDMFGFNLTSMFVAILGAVVVLFLWHAITGDRTLR